MPMERFVVVLDRPLYSINLGYIARVMANLGCEELRLVEPRAAVDEWSISMSMEGRAVLESARTFKDFKEALADLEITLATTRRVGKRKVVVMTPEQAGRAILGFPPNARVGVVFGAEDRGLSNHQVAACTFTVFIPGKQGCESYNLSHAVAIVLYSIRSQFYSSPFFDASRALEIEGLVEHAGRVLEATGFLAVDDPHKAKAKLRALLYRGRAHGSEIGLLHALLDHISRLANTRKNHLHHPPSTQLNDA